MASPSRSRSTAAARSFTESMHAPGNGAVRGRPTAHVPGEKDGGYVQNPMGPPLSGNDAGPAGNPLAAHTDLTGRPGPARHPPGKTFTRRQRSVQRDPTKLNTAQTYPATLNLDEREIIGSFFGRRRQRFSDRRQALRRHAKTGTTSVHAQEQRHPFGAADAVTAADRSKGSRLRHRHRPSLAAGCGPHYWRAARGKQRAMVRIKLTLPATPEPTTRYTFPRRSSRVWKTRNHEQSETYRFQIVHAGRARIRQQMTVAKNLDYVAEELPYVSHHTEVTFDPKCSIRSSPRLRSDKKTMGFQLRERP